MSTLLMVESWLHSTGRGLPPVVEALGHEYILFTRDPALYPPDHDGRPHPVVAGAREIVVVDTNDDAVVAAAATELARRQRIDGVLTTCDYYLGTVATVARALGLPGADPDVMRRATQKHLVRAALDDAGLPNPAYAVAADWPTAQAAAARIGTPLITKPVDLNAGTSVERIDNDAALKDAFWSVTEARRNTRGQPRSRLLLMEQRMTGVEVSVEAVTVDGRTTVVGITDKSLTAPPACVESGHMFPAALDPAVAREAAGFAAEALAAIGFTHGLSHVEVMLTPDGPRVVEINPRQAGGYIFDLVHLVTGTHPLEMLVELALGRMPDLDGGGVVALGRPVPGVGRPLSAAVYFVMSPRDGVVDRITGVEQIGADPFVYRWELDAPGPVRRPRDNDAYIGHLVVVDPDGLGARRHVERLVGGLRLHFRDGDVTTPLLSPLSP
ncbi:ATP-grasp domain-containing protein [Phytoactinopolyspora limicola]|uniref:ATP-grasp domain-containing protein n=1 Tax=Phytoactinopolyspora limicola TaxID=2715536 RepID=UPI00140E15E2|nr:ATP-grasp domain-containing protein [Phytoactinopolyspora limicola]